MRYLFGSLLMCALLAGTTYADAVLALPSTSAAGQPDAIVRLDASSIAAGIGYLWGDGNIVYSGKSHAFKLSGVSIADIGGAHITANGAVYNLKHLSDFSGKYTTVSVGLTVGGGGSVAVLRNGHGVVIKLRSTTRGLKLNLSTDGIAITLES